MPEITVRLYQPADRPAIRRLAWETSDPAAATDLLDAEFVADLLTDYYVRWAPGTVWVAQIDNTVAGYLTGCLQERRYAQLMAWRIVPGAICRAWARGRLGSPRLWGRAVTWLLALRRQEQAARRPYPAHLHINLDPRFRRQGIGPRLMERFLAQVRDAGVPGVCAGVRADNAAARRFFERLGFIPAFRHPSFSASDTVVYAKRL